MILRLGGGLLGPAPAKALFFLLRRGKSSQRDLLRNHNANRRRTLKNRKKLDGRVSDRRLFARASSYTPNAMKLNASTVCKSALFEYVKSDAVKTTETSQRKAKIRLNSRRKPAREPRMNARRKNATVRTD